MTGLTPRQVEFLGVVRALRRERVAPTYPEIRRRLGWASISLAWQYTERLIKLGYLEHGKMLALVRGPVLTAKGKRVAA